MASDSTITLLCLRAGLTALCLILPVHLHASELAAPDWVQWQWHADPALCVRTQVAAGEPFAVVPGGRQQERAEHDVEGEARRAAAVLPGFRRRP